MLVEGGAGGECQRLLPKTGLTARCHRAIPDFVRHRR